MLQKFNQHLQSTKLIAHDDYTIVACSGGSDSMALAGLLKAAEMKFCLAHVNFQLRGEDSELDQEIVQTWGKDNGIEVYVKRFKTDAIAEETGQSIQATARRLRYLWFDQLKSEIQATAIATAHHSDDQVETHLWHLMRGSSWSGFTGIPPVHGDIVRPLLFATKKELTSYVAENNIPFRTDKSNASDKYMRNRIRNEVIPLLEDIRPGFKHNVHRQIAAFSEAGYIIDQFMSELESGMLNLGSNGIELNVEDLKEMPFSRLLLLHVLPDYGFPGRRVSEVLNLLNAQVGKALYSSTHRIVRERESIQIRPIPLNTSEETLISQDDLEIHSPAHLVLEISENTAIPKMGSPNEAVFDLDKIKFPLKLRRWKSGDKLQPFGMEGTQKVSDLLIQKKLTTSEKENTFVLKSGNVIIWVIGIRTSAASKVSTHTSKALRIKHVEIS
ncbi:MAG: tRNA(Ile)-lysidine synthase [Flavobacteriales bacterium]|jgi:tRNA(Ile)-lysidine synthase